MFFLFLKAVYSVVFVKNHTSIRVAARCQLNQKSICTSADERKTHLVYAFIKQHSIVFSHTDEIPSFQRMCFALVTSVKRDCACSSL